MILKKKYIFIYSQSHKNYFPIGQNEGLQSIGVIICDNSENYCNVC